METKFNFKSQVCTSREQSERLLALGLKKETADMAIFEYLDFCPEDNCNYPTGEYEVISRRYAKNFLFSRTELTPAWSLGRLIEMVAHTQYPYYVISKELPIYDALCERIEWLIKEGYFNKDYLI